MEPSLLHEVSFLWGCLLWFCKSTIRPCMEVSFHDWVGAPCCKLNICGKLQKQECRTVNHSLETLPNCLNAMIVSLFCRYCFDRYSSELSELFLLPYLSGRSLAILKGWVIFLSPFLDVIRISMPAVSFLAKLDRGILCLRNGFPWLTI